MYKSLFIIIVTLSCLLSCTKDSDIKHLKDGFVTEVGKYKIGEDEFELFRVVNGSLVFAMQDSDKNLLFQHGIGSPFSSYQMWALFFDENQNLWFYNSDYTETYVWIQRENGEYTYHNWCKENLPLPTRFQNQIGSKKNGLCPNI